MQPKLIIGGIGKCGTNAIANILDQNGGYRDATPFAFNEEMKRRGWTGEINWPCNELHWSKLYKLYVKHFVHNESQAVAWQKHGPFKFAYDKSTAYANHIACPTLIHSAMRRNPKFKGIIFVICDPIKSAWSRFNMLRTELKHDFPVSLALETARNFSSGSNVSNAVSSQLAIMRSSVDVLRVAKMSNFFRHVLQVYGARYGSLDPSATKPESEMEKPMDPQDPDSVIDFLQKTEPNPEQSMDKNKTSLQDVCDLLLASFNGTTVEEEMRYLALHFVLQLVLQGKKMTKEETLGFAENVVQFTSGDDAKTACVLMLLGGSDHLEERFDIVNRLFETEPQTSNGYHSGQMDPSVEASTPSPEEIAKCIFSAFAESFDLDCESVFSSETGAVHCLKVLLFGQYCSTLELLTLIFACAEAGAEAGAEARFGSSRNAEGDLKQKVKQFLYTTFNAVVLTHASEYASESPIYSFGVSSSPFLYIRILDEEQPVLISSLMPFLEVLSKVLRKNLDVSNRHFQVGEAFAYCLVALMFAVFSVRAQRAKNTVLKRLLPGSGSDIAKESIIPILQTCIWQAWISYDFMLKRHHNDSLEGYPPYSFVQEGGTEVQNSMENLHTFLYDEQTLPAGGVSLFVLFALCYNSYQSETPIKSTVFNMMASASMFLGMSSLPTRALYALTEESENGMLRRVVSSASVPAYKGPTFLLAALITSMMRSAPLLTAEGAVKENIASVLFSLTLVACYNSFPKFAGGYGLSPFQTRIKKTFTTAGVFQNSKESFDLTAKNIDEMKHALSYGINVNTAFSWVLLYLMNTIGQIALKYMVKTAQMDLTNVFDDAKRQIEELKKILEDIVNETEGSEELLADLQTGFEHIQDGSFPSQEFKNFKLKLREALVLDPAQQTQAFQALIQDAAPNANMGTPGTPDSGRPSKSPVRQRDTGTGGQEEEPGRHLQEARREGNQSLRGEQLKQDPPEGLHYNLDEKTRQQNQSAGAEAPETPQCSMIILILPPLFCVNE